ncbi:rod shape-determining protein RodA [Acidihalobacter ferrooxydans]|uniref:Peptidoglycan glycosyltransferase MrdB n=2 Tax=Acidihalobacter ferrooxydans TaxID=1765967 RepID=A0A1P8ULM6_9GAMM|nr:rod shape-determining protein RodA [Acidihalobacter ferrooxydans]APZ44731.1 rod shape-determining protein RodA [Acidihalobacter ferrooxydans]
MRVLRWLHLDGVLLAALLLLGGVGLVILYSAGGEHFTVVSRQAIRLGLAFVGMLALAQVPPQKLRRLTPWLYLGGLLLLALVLGMAVVGKGAQRWLDLGIVRFQPSEIMKLAVPMAVAWFFSRRPLPPRGRDLLMAGLIVALPAAMIARQPDLGTALLVAMAGFFVIFLSGVRYRVLFALFGLALAALPVLWHFMHGYQRDRVLTFLKPESDPLGAGYHIIQSMIAVGSGGLYGKGWLNGSQAQLDFLPERSTDFIFSVFGEEFGLLGAGLLLALYVFIVLRGLSIAVYAQDTYSRLLAGSISLTFAVYVFVNVGMVVGLLPVVGVPLPLVSYGGTSMVTLLAAFGMLMSIHSHRTLVAH